MSFDHVPVSIALQEKLAAIDGQIQSQAAQHTAILIAVTKYASLEQMAHLHAAGVRHFGENKVQDALEKMTALPPEILKDLTWHLIGHLQGNKVSKVVGSFDWIHSVDSLALAQRIDQRAMALEIRQKVLLQVNITQESTKNGFSVEALSIAMPSLLSLNHLMLGGLMTIAPAQADEKLLKEVFTSLQNLIIETRNQVACFFKTKVGDEHANHAPCLDFDMFKDEFVELSMGMSSDYRVALNCGSTMIRVGQYLLQSA